MENRFNQLTSKEWLPFQKSWFRYQDERKLYEENIRFFTKSQTLKQKVFYSGINKDLFVSLCEENNLVPTFSLDDDVQFALIDLRSELKALDTFSEYEVLRTKTSATIEKLFEKVLERRFICVVAENLHLNNIYYPFAWDLSYLASSVFSLKDEKIGCFLNDEANSQEGQEYFYSLYFRKDENSSGVTSEKSRYSFGQIPESPFPTEIPGWFILKPQRRTKDEILHPAKYPEDLVRKFVAIFTSENQNVFDPMSGTGSSQLGAMQVERNGYGVELSDTFGAIAIERCTRYKNKGFESLFSEDEMVNSDFRIEIGDARDFRKFSFPIQNYLITSPPYWDMLNMKGAENQAKRIEDGLRTNYSDNENDLGNIADYDTFVDTLIAIYQSIFEILEPGSFVTIVVKNIKKKGTNYPFAWDISRKLSETIELLPESFWLQDDISIAPFGFGNTWVSNTFHQYCLNFRIPFN